MTLDLVLRGGTLVSPQATRPVTIGLAAGRVVLILDAAESLAGREVRDLDGLLLLPGLIDCHVHCREPGGHAHKGTYASESRAAAAGGVTTMLTMPNTVPFCGSAAVLAAARECAQRSLIDYGFHFGVTADNLAEVAAAADLPVAKLYLNETTGITSPLADDAVLRRVLALGLPLSAHAEGDTLDWLLGLHARWGTGPLYVVHVALAREVAALRAAKARGQWVYAEATTHHLLLTDQDAARLGPYGDMRPTLKTAADQAALWAGLADGTIDTIATDHAPHLREEKESGSPPPGVPGLQTLLPLLLEQVAAGRLTLAQVVRLTAAQPAAIFGLCGKGAVAVGSDADLVAVDPTAATVIEHATQYTWPGWTPFDGWTCRGRVEAVWRRGELVYEAGQEPGTGGGREVTVARAHRS
ncbi:MAG: dihydroorotase family protein [Fimbriimonadaceae bacterium]|nr:dihydroorotase family protein [Fimbriimonadaceae bacterium]